MAKSKDADIDTDDIRGMISKWASIPFGIVVVLVAGGALNLIPYFLELKDQLGFEPIHQEFIRWGVLFGYFGGILAGPLVDMIGTTISFVISAIIAGGGFIALAFYSDASSISTFNTILVVSLVLLVSFACAIATIASIATVILNFSRNVGAMIAAVMIAYYFAAPFFDLSVRGGYFEDVELKTNMLVSGGIHFVIYLLAAFIVDENEQSPRLKRASALTDRFGILIYAAIAGGFLAVVYFTCIIAEQFKLAIVLITLIILLNFVVLGFTVQALIGRINDSDTSNVADEDIPPKKHFGEMFADIRYWCLLFGVFVVVGTGATYYAEAADVAEAVGQPDVADKIDYAYWLSAVAAILGGGLFAAMFNALLNAWIFAAIGAFSSMVGFGLVFLADVHPAFFYTSAFFVGAGVGTWWVVVPQIILDDAGPRSFESLWGLTLTVAAAGMFAFDRLFWWISSKTEPDTKGDCDGSACFLVPYVLSAALCLIAGILAIVGFNNDEGTGGAGGKDERKPLRKNDKNKEKDRGRSKSKDGKRSGSKSKSKGKKSKSKSKK
jgi:hypothetical protein